MEFMGHNGAMNKMENMIYSNCVAIKMAKDEDNGVLTLQYSHQSVSLSRRRLFAEQSEHLC
jgi:hypothetical protein